MEDDPLLGEAVKDFLEKEGFRVIWVQGMLEALEEGMEGKDLALVDWMLPDGSGLDLLRRWKEDDPSFPVIFLTVRSAVDDRVHALEIGADDYVIKPFHPPELVARIHAVLRRTYAPLSRFTIHGVEVDLDAGVVRTREGVHPLPRKEWLLLRELWKRRNRVVRYAHLLRVLWEEGEEKPSRASLQVYVSHLRKLLGRETIENVRHLGYRLKA